MSSVVRLLRAPLLADAPYAYAATAPGDYAAQAARCVETLQGALTAAGATLTDVIGTRVLVASSAQRDLVAAWDVVHAAFGPHDVPSTLLGVTVLGYDDQLVEIEAIAALPADRA